MCSRRRNAEWNFDITDAEQQYEAIMRIVEDDDIPCGLRWDAWARARDIAGKVFAFTGKVLPVLAGLTVVALHTRRGVAVAAGVGASGAAALMFAALTMRLTPNTDSVPVTPPHSRGASSRNTSDAQWAATHTTLPKPSTARHATHRPAVRHTTAPTPVPTRSAIPKPPPPSPITPSPHHTHPPLIEATVGPTIRVRVNPPKLPVQLPTDVQVVPPPLPRITIPPLPTRGLNLPPILNGDDGHHQSRQERPRSPELRDVLGHVLGAG